jgi:hypothetical protein
MALFNDLHELISVPLFLPCLLRAAPAQYAWADPAAFFNYLMDE